MHFAKKSEYRHLGQVTQFLAGVGDSRKLDSWTPQRGFQPKAEWQRRFKHFVSLLAVEQHVDGKTIND